jgi:ubiquinone/menaquinone biosynthesis C-methylase UbiE
MKTDFLSVQDGYAKWAQTYDRENNPLIRLEERALSGLVKDVPAVVLDAACGTGRHAIRFAVAGSQVLGVDASPEMLARARTKANELGLSRIQFVRGLIDEGLPVRSRSVDMTVCALALCHIRRVQQAISTLCRTVKPGGRLLITDLHPVAISCGLVTLFSDGRIERGIETVSHTREEYQAAMESAGAAVIEELDLALGEVFPQEPHGLPSGVYERGWRDLPFCLILLGRVEG